VRLDVHNIAGVIAPGNLYRAFPFSVVQIPVGTLLPRDFPSHDQQHLVTGHLTKEPKYTDTTAACVVAWAPRKWWATVSYIPKSLPHLRWLFLCLNTLLPPRPPLPRTSADHLVSLQERPSTIHKESTTDTAVVRASSNDTLNRQGNDYKHRPIYSFHKFFETKPN
jgi:hypothetical protein